jgi:hypothetical protein
MIALAALLALQLGQIGLMPGAASSWPVLIDKPPCAHEFVGTVLEPSDCTPWVLYKPTYWLVPTPSEGMTECDPKGKIPWGFKCWEERDIERTRHEQSQFMLTPGTLTEPATLP